jgi:hypothetical protein
MTSKLKQLLVGQLEQIPGVVHQPWPDRDDGFSALLFRGKDLGHFHNFHELDLRLGKALIKAEGLRHPADSKQHPGRSLNSPFIELRFHNERDVAQIVRLVQLAVTR